MFIQTTQGAALNLKDLKIKYPRSIEKMREYFKGMLLEFQVEMLKDIAKEGLNSEEYDIPEVTNDLVDESMENLFLSGTLRSLYDFFDKEGVFVAIYPPGESSDWIWSITHEDLGMFPLSSMPNSYQNRTKTEVHAFSAAFELMEKKL